jgi:hypothetical protein
MPAAISRALLISGITLIPVLLLGLHRRSLLRLCYSLPIYLVSVWLGDLVLLAWPERFRNWDFYVAKETLYGGLKLAIAVELASLAFGRFPGAAATARRALLLGLLLTAATLALGPPITIPGLYGVALALQPRLANGTVLLLLIVWILVLWYHVPVHRLHRAIVRGLVPYLLLFGNGVTLQMLGRGWDVWRLVSILSASAYVALLIYWTWEAWRRVEEPKPSDAVDPLLAWRARL